jgi:hypothetical protein
MAALGGAAAQEVYVDDMDGYDDETYVETPALEDDAPIADGIVVGPRVYGWSEIRPANCGTFRYWNGETCADARFDPPAPE